MGSVLWGDGSWHGFGLGYIEFELYILLVDLSIVNTGVSF
jgi:hypothetical protein